MLHNGVIVSKAFNENEDSLRATVTGNAILYLQVGDQVNSMLTFKVIREKSRGEWSLIVQDTIENVSEHKFFFLTF